MSVRTDLIPGAELLGFRVERVIGRGGMGVVYLAHQLVLDRMVALKLLAPELAADGEFRERFLRESRLAASLDHPNIVPVFDAGEVEGRLYIAMRYVEGRDLGRLLAEEGPLGPERALALLDPLADALDAAHAKGLVHRDVKPSNVLVDEAERPYMADFGLTKEASEKGLVEQSHFAASLEYVAPEQVEGRPVDGRADQYALACVLYECLTGATPFANDSPMATLWGHLDEPPPKAAERNPRLQGDIDAVFERALAKEPRERYPTCSEFIGAARGALGLEQPPRLLRPRWLAALAAVLLLVVAAVAVGAVVAFGGDGAPKPDLSPRDNSVLRIDPDRGEITAVIDLGEDPTGVAAYGDTVWVYNLADGTVSEIDAESDTVAETRAVAGRAPLETYGEGVIAADEGGAWIVTQTGIGRGLLTRLRPAPLRKLEYPLDYEPYTIALGEGRIWVTARSLGRGHLLRIDPRTGTVNRAIEIDWPLATVVVGEGAVWTMTTESRHSPTVTRVLSTITRWHPDTLEPTGRLHMRPPDWIVGGPLHLGVGAGALWLHREPRRLRIVDAKTLRPSGTKPMHPDNKLFGTVYTDDALWLIDAPTGGIYVSEPSRIGFRRLDPESHDLQKEFALPMPPRGTDAYAPVPRQAAVGADSLWITISNADV